MGNLKNVIIAAIISTATFSFAEEALRVTQSNANYWTDDTITANENSLAQATTGLEKPNCQTEAYYKKYFDTEVSSGRSIQEVMKNLAEMKSGCQSRYF